MWHVVYYRKSISSAIPETFRYSSNSKLRAFLVYMLWRTGYTLGSYEVRDLKMYKADAKVIYMDQFRRRAK